MMVIGITGGTGCGKTTLLRRVEAMGGCVIDCDAVYHRLLEEDPALLRAVEARFPGVTDGGVLDRKKLGKVVFEDPAALADLNRIAHPFVHQDSEIARDKARRQGVRLAAVDAIALLEGGLGSCCDFTVAVTAPEEARVRRLVAREGISEDYARLRVAAQKRNEEFAAGCDRTVCNDYDTEAEFAQVCDRLLAEWTGGNKHE